MPVKKKKSVKKKSAQKRKVRSSQGSSAKKKVTSVRSKSTKKAVKSKPKLAKKSKNKKSTGSRKSVKTTGSPDRKTAGSSQSTSAKKSKIFSKKFNIGTRVLMTAGRFSGVSGTVVRQDPYLCTFFVTFDHCQNDPLYQSVEWGPYFEAELTLLKTARSRQK